MDTLFIMLVVHPSARTGDVWGNFLIGVISTLIVSLLFSLMAGKKEEKSEYLDEVKKDDKKTKE